MKTNFTEEEYIKYLINKSFDDKSGDIMSVNVVYTSYDSDVAWCYDGLDTIAEFVSLNEAKIAASDYLSNLDCSNPSRIEQPGWAYGHMLEIEYHSKDSIKEEIEKLTLKLNKLNKLI